MARESSSISEEVASRARGLDRYLMKMEKLRIEGALSELDVERAYTGAYLEFHAYFERAIERLFVGLLDGRLKPARSSIKARIGVSSATVATDVVNGDRTFVDWLPFDRTSRRARAFFQGGRPFIGLDKQERRDLAEFTTIRNALAHQSRASLRRFSSDLIQGRALPPAQLRPGGFLRGTHTLGQTRMSYQLARAVSIIDKLAR